MPSQQPNWQPISSLRATFERNRAALAPRDPALSERLGIAAEEGGYVVAASGSQLMLGRRAGPTVTPVHDPLPPAAATQIAGKLFPSGNVDQPVLVAGLDLGWLWQMLAKAPVSAPMMPGFTPPLFFLTADIHRLAAVLHLHDLSGVLGSGRARLFVGNDAVETFAASLTRDLDVPWPRLSVTLEPGIWPIGQTLDSILAAAGQSVERELAGVRRRLDAAYRAADPRGVAALLADPAQRILGITSRFTTVLQHSMRDWLSAFESMGGATRLLIEAQDHERVHPLTMARACEQFRPTLIVMIDHYRAEIPVLPQNLPCVMWIQDLLPNIFNPSAGARQGRYDYHIGYATRDMHDELGYPRSRFMMAMPGFNHRRFEMRPPDAEERRAFGCDIAFISHASLPADRIVQAEVAAHNSPEAAKLLWSVYERLRAVYDAGQCLTEPADIRQVIQDAAIDTGIRASDPRSVETFFVQRVNNALFRHQAIGWAADLGVDLRLYGKGWDQHARFARFARGVADNQTQFAAICRASAINLQVTPLGTVHPRLLDGIAAGGFYLLRHVLGDDIERCYEALWGWCRRRDIDGDEAFDRLRDGQVQAWIDRIEYLSGEPMLRPGETAFGRIRERRDEGFTRAASTLFTEFDLVSFRNRGEFIAQAQRYLNAPEARQRLAEAMHRAAVAKLTYEAVTRRTLELIRGDLAASAAVRAAA